MAEGFFRSFYGEKYEICSAGSEPQGIDPLAIDVMDEIGIDISQQTSNSLNDYHGQEFDYVITVCGEYGACPFFLGGKKYLIIPFQDPSTFVGTETEKIEFIREVRDEIGDWVQDLVNYDTFLEDSNSDSESDCCDSDDPNCCIPDLTKNNTNTGE
jgi:arsenate reductase